MGDIRSIKENELEKWLDHLETVFSFKGTQRSYFKRHWDNDPWRNFDHIFIIERIKHKHKDVGYEEDEDEEEGEEKDSKGEGGQAGVDNVNLEIASSLRLFQREMYFNGQKIKVSGVGEVSTKEKYRSLGLASSLLSHSVSFSLQNNFSLLFLHSSSSADYYESKGWQRIPLYFLNLSLSPSSINHFIQRCGSQENLYIIECDFKNERLRSQMANIYKKIVINYSGPIVREEDSYWEKWIGSESSKENKRNPVCFCLLDKETSSSSSSSSKNLLAYIVVEEPQLAKSDEESVVLKVKEFIWREEAEDVKNERLYFFCNLIKRSLDHFNLHHHSHLKILTPFITEMKEFCSTNEGKRIFEISETVIDDGYLFKFLRNDKLHFFSSPFLFLSNDLI